MIKNLTLLCLSLVLLGACTKEADLPPVGEGTGQRVKSRFVLRAEIPGEIETRAVDDNAITDLWVVQCVGGNVEGTPTYLPANININDVAAELAASNGTVYFFANTGNASLLTDVTTEAGVQALSHTFTYDATTTASLPMYGQWTGTPVQGIINTPVSIYRTVAKVTFNLSSSLPASPVLRLTKVQLIRVPKKILLVRDQESLDTGTTYPEMVADDFTDLAASFDNAAGEVLTDTKTFTWYLPENHRGTGSAQTQKNKTALTAAEGQGDYCTYVEITFKTADDDKYIYRIWLGANNYNDYNLQRNTHYTVSTRILGMNLTDTRITYEINNDPAVYLGPGGELVGNPETGYKFNKLIYAAEANTGSTTRFANTASELGFMTNFLDGKGNTWALHQNSSTEYLAVNACFTLNDGYQTINTKEDPRFKWFLPSFYQTYLMSWSQNLTATTWSSTQVQVGESSTQVYSMTSNSVEFPSITQSDQAAVRCVKDRELPSYIEPMLYKKDGAIVLDLSFKTGFPQHLVETVKGKKIAAGTPSTNGGPMTDNTLDGTINKTVYQKLEIAKTDASSLNWANAYNHCKQLGEGWRLPTVRELMLIMIFKNTIVDLGSDSFTQSNYWSSIEKSSTQSFVVSFLFSYPTVSTKTNNDSYTFRTRCVRELD